MDQFRSFQKSKFPISYNQKRKRSCYGCECCMRESLPKLKKSARRYARTMMKRLELEEKMDEKAIVEWVKARNELAQLEAEGNGDEEYSAFLRDLIALLENDSD